MTAIIRVKRRIDEDPVDTLVLNCKKRKTEDNIVSLDKTLLRFVTTCNDASEDVAQHIRKTTKEHLQTQYKSHTHNITAKIKEQRSNAARLSRFKLINHFRTRTEEQNEESLSTIGNNNNCTVLDVVQDDENKSPDTEDPIYVYDLYYTKSIDFAAEENLNYQDIDIHPLSQELVYGSARDNGINSSSSDDSEDSNAESNWRNDYPDEDPDADKSSITEGDMVHAMKSACLGSDLSSTDDENVGFGCDVDSEAVGFDKDINVADMCRYGERYARFKAKHSKPNNPDEYFSDLCDDDDDSYY